MTFLPLFFPRWGGKGPKGTPQTPSGQTWTQLINTHSPLCFHVPAPDLATSHKVSLPAPLHPRHLSWEEETRTPLDCHPGKLACLVAWLNILTGGSQYKSLKPIEHSSWWGRLCYSNDRNRRLEARTAQSSGRKAKPKVSLELPPEESTSPQSCGTGQQTRN